MCLPHSRFIHGAARQVRLVNLHVLVLDLAMVNFKQLLPANQNDPAEKYETLGWFSNVAKLIYLKNILESFGIRQILIYHDLRIYFIQRSDICRSPSHSKADHMCFSDLLWLSSSCPPKPHHSIWWIYGDEMDESSSQLYKVYGCLWRIQHDTIIVKMNGFIWVNYNDLTATSLESWLVRGIIPKWPNNSGEWNIIIYPDLYILYSLITKDDISLELCTINNYL